MTSFKKPMLAVTVFTGLVGVAACNSGSAHSSTDTSTAAQVATYSVGYDYGSDLLKSTYHGKEPDFDEAMGACNDGVGYERERLYRSHGLTPVEIAPITDEEFESYNALNEEIGEDPDSALDGYQQGCQDALDGQPATPSIWDRASAATGDPYAEGYTFATYKLPILKGVAKEESIADPVEEAIAVCQVNVLIAVDQLAIAKDPDTSQWEKAPGIEDRHRDFIAGCEDAANGKPRAAPKS
ncbi:hypothetical protein ACIBLA_36070 [Streptomyces sp. NPDC050433]|uniref:hypothetical protein n=1 Tax=Streptomyces sp. NPDC050433 TaxID=3365615 RepID=UPI0037AD52C9